MIKPLTALRFIFAFMVLMSHFNIFSESESPFLYHLFYEGYVGVSFFFVLSGFILAYSYQERFMSGNVGKKTFYISRIARIYPMHVVGVLVYIWIRKEYPVDFHYIATLFKYLTLTQSYTELEQPTFNAASWSLSCELFFYLLFPFIIGWFIKSKRTLVIFFGLLVSIVAVVTFRLEENDFSEWLLYTSPYFRMVDFGIGIALLQFCQSGILDNRRKQISPTGLEVSALLLLLLFYCGAYYVPQNYRHAIWYWIPISFLIYVFYYQAGRISKLLSTKTWVLLGEISFSFYLVQGFINHYVKRADALLDIPVPQYALFIVLAVVTTIVSYLSFRYIEKPANKFIKRAFLKG